MRDRWSLKKIADRESISFDSTLRFFAGENEDSLKHDLEYNGYLWDNVCNEEENGEPGIFGLYPPRFHLTSESVKSNLRNFIRDTNCLSRDFVPTLRNSYPPNVAVNDYSDPTCIPVMICNIYHENGNTPPWYYSISYDGKFCLDPKDPFRSFCLMLGHTFGLVTQYCAFLGYGSNRVPIYDNKSFWELKPHRHLNTRVIVLIPCDHGIWNPFRKKYMVRPETVDGQVYAITYKHYARRTPVKVLKWDPREFVPDFDFNVGLKYRNETQKKKHHQFVTLRSDPPGVKHYGNEIVRVKHYPNVEYY